MSARDEPGGGHADPGPGARRRDRVGAVARAAVRRAARAVLTRAVGAPERSPWGSAILREDDEIRGTWAAVRWAAGGVRVALTERRRRRARHRTPLSPRWSVARLVLSCTALTWAAVFLLNQYALTVRYVPSGAMEPTVQVADRLLVDRFTPRFTAADPGDIVTVDRTSREGLRYEAVLRVIGVPGDRIECRDGVVHRNGAALREPYVSGADPTDCVPVTVADGELYLLGDHRDAANDSRSYGAVRADTVTGRVLARAWPPGAL